MFMLSVDKMLLQEYAVYLSLFIHRDRNKMDDVLKTTFSNAYFNENMLILGLNSTEFFLKDPIENILSQHQFLSVNMDFNMCFALFIQASGQSTLLAVRNPLSMIASEIANHVIMPETNTIGCLRIR